jgi:ABC-type enterobactin transport system permease subunit
MTPIECEFERDVHEAVAAGRWPTRVEPELRAHAQQCEICQDAVIVARAFAESDLATTRRALPEASLVWWRAQARAKADAARQATRPITVAQAIAFAAIVGFAGALLGASSPWLQTLLHWGAGAFKQVIPESGGISGSLEALFLEHTATTLAAMAGIVITPIAVYLAVRES